MSVAELSPGLRRLIVGAIATVPHLEALLLLRAQPREWSGHEVGARLYISPERAESVLSELASCGLLRATDGGFAYRPDDTTTAPLVDELAEVYARHVVDVTSFIHSRTDRAAQQFADAFLLRKGDRQ
ncbi:MAG TPA: hypothetical protein VFL14_02570 [Xanthomonadales bacterium]|nr:hypothetical protein [Xanthomonadales bacterium]